MKKEEMEELAQIIVSKFLDILSQREDELEGEFLQDIIMRGTSHMISDEEMLMGELARLQTILMIYEDKEQYEKAAVIMDKINRIQYKLKKL
tara:strand:- start:468 stop:743 length:276 start_codon:yes stop_codon:yes gene_type:complete